MRVAAVTALATVLAAATAGLAAGQAASPSLGPLCARLADDLGFDQALVGTFIGSLPEPPSRSFCTWLTENQTHSQACDFLALLDFGLTNGGNFEPPPCDNPGTSAIDATPSSGNLTKLIDRRPLPANFSDPASVFAEEGATYYQLWRMVRNVYYYAPCAPQPNATLALPPGWSLLATGDLPQAVGPALPLLFVLQNNATNQLVLIVRSTEGSYEWSRNFAFNQTSDTTSGALFGGNVSVGFLSNFEEIWPVAQAALEDYVVNTGGPPPEVFVTGHSAGGAEGTLLAYAAAQYLETSMGDQAPVVDTVLFAPPQVGDASFVDEYNRLVNGRMIDYVDDLVNQVPCDPEMPACSGTPTGLLGTVGVRGTKTDQGGVQYWPYGSVGGEMRIFPQDLPADNATWAKITSMPLCWATIYLQAVHSCSYSCYLSSFASDPADRDQSCWLSPQPAGAAGTQCPGFPNGYLTPQLAAGPSPASEAPTAAPTTSPTAPAPTPAATSGAASATFAGSALSALLALLAAALLA